MISIYFLFQTHHLRTIALDISLQTPVLYASETLWDLAKFVLSNEKLHPEPVFHLNCQIWGFPTHESFSFFLSLSLFKWIEAKRDLPLSLSLSFIFWLEGRIKIGTLNTHIPPRTILEWLAWRACSCLGSGRTVSNFHIVSRLFIYLSVMDFIFSGYWNYVFNSYTVRSKKFACFLKPSGAVYTCSDT